ncbi:MAG TPA: YifB family Mg chelatase-like AAA ATPase [Chloroflexia bacterium]|nr:YifB family Mg chelatase-like AAA ATPase [Chloroflexia bacterium]
MLAKVLSCAVVGLEGAIVEVEVDISNAGLPAFQLVGLPDTAVQEARERVRSAIRNSWAVFPNKKITVNLAPGDLRKEGPAYDLPIAVGVLLASEQLSANLENTLFLGELSLDGALRHTDGVLPMVAVGRKHGIKRVFVPATDAAEAALLEDLEVIPVESLSALVRHLRGEQVIAPYKLDLENLEQTLLAAEAQYDFSVIKGQEHAKRALEVAAAGNHNLLMSGPPGSGKTLLARTMVSILPRLTIEEALEVTKIYSVAGLLSADTPLMRTRPFRAPHHTISNAGLVGGGRSPRPGEISLAHRGVLFLDELPEFGQTMLDNLRQPLEDRTLVISRASGTLSFPANFIFISAMNPCPCGYFGDAARACTCSPSVVTRYQKRLSGPLLDRIDIHVEVARVEYEKLSDSRLGEPSTRIRERVERAREIQRRRFAGYKATATEAADSEAAPSAHHRVMTNAEMGPAEIREFCQVDSAGQAHLKAATRQLQLSARAYHRVLKLSRTIADLSGSENIQASHIAEAIQYRRKEAS